MARIIYSFEHPKDKRRYFYLQNTFYETLETIPMDLANFMWYYQSNKNNLKGFEDVYLRLKEKGSYLLNDSFYSKSEEEKDMLFALVIHSGANEMAKINKSISDKLDEYLSNNHDDDIILGTSTILRKSKFIAFRPLDFYLSWHNIWYYFYSHELKHDNIFSLKKIMLNEKEIDLEAYASHFIDLVQNHDMPISAIPHVVRNIEIVRNYIMEQNFHMLLPFQASELLKERKVHKLIKKKPNNDEINSFFRFVKNANYGISNQFIKSIEEFNKPEEELTIFEKKEILNKLLDEDLELVGLEDLDKNQILPTIYTDSFFKQEETEDLYILFKYGIQTLDLYSKYGKLIYKEAYNYDLMFPYVFVTEHSMEIKIMKYNEETDTLYLMPYLNDCSIDSNHLFAKEGEGKIFFMNGFINEDFELQSPFCFDQINSYGNSEKCFSEGLSPASLNGKWGFVDHSSNIVIPFEYGDAYPFKDGKAKVFKLKEEFKITIGEWKEIPSYETQVDRFKMTPHQFNARFPSFPKIVRKPFAHFRNSFIEHLQLAMDYHSFENGVVGFEAEKWDVSYFGKWITIDKQGNELEDLSDEKVIDEKKSIIENYLFKNQDADYWMKTILKNNYEVNNLPDSLYLNKEFILEMIENCPNSFNHLNYIYSDDVDCKLAFEEAIKKTKSITKEDGEVNGSEIEIINDDLPF